jgi:hypothetical protein
VNTLLNMGVTWIDGKLVTSCKTLSYSTRTALYAVIYVLVQRLFMRGSSIRNKSDINQFFVYTLGCLYDFKQ